MSDGLYLSLLITICAILDTYVLDHPNEFTFPPVNQSELSVTAFVFEAPHSYDQRIPYVTK